MKKSIVIISLLITSLILAGCLSIEESTLTVLTHDDFAVSEPVIQQFEKSHQVKVVFIKNGDAGSVLNQAILTKDTPIADVLYGIDNTFLSRALGENLFIIYESPVISEIKSEYLLDPQYRALPVDYSDVCINYDKTYFLNNNLAIPQNLADLIKPEYRNLLVVENPATSSPGLAFLLTTIAQFGDPGYLQYWQQLKANGTVIVDSWGTAYYTNFSGSSGQGAQPMVLSYVGSPAAEVVFADPPRTDSPTGSILADGTCFRQVEFAGILKGTNKVQLAQQFIDFLLSRDFQEDIPLQMFMYPVNRNAQLPQVFLDFAQLSAHPAQINVDAISQNRDDWIRTWTEAILH